MPCLSSASHAAATRPNLLLCCRLLPPQCLKYRSDQLQDVKRMEKLNNQLMRHMVNKHGEAQAGEQ